MFSESGDRGGGPRTAQDREGAVCGHRSVGFLDAGPSQAPMQLSRKNQACFTVVSTSLRAEAGQALREHRPLYFINNRVPRCRPQPAPKINMSPNACVSSPWTSRLCSDPEPGGGGGGPGRRVSHLERGLPAGVVSVHWYVGPLLAMNLAAGF